MRGERVLETVDEEAGAEQRAARELAGVLMSLGCSIRLVRKESNREKTRERRRQTNKQTVDKSRPKATSERALIHAKRSCQVDQTVSEL